MGAALKLDQSSESPSTFAQIEERGHEQVVFLHDPAVGLKAVVAIHNTTLGPALGGCRMRLYDNENQAIEDAIRLSEGMTYKSSVAGLDLGGGKAVLIADPAMSGEPRRRLFLRFGEMLNWLGGRYITAEDMGTCVQDVMTMREVTKYAAGFASELGGSGDPSPYTALGVFRGMEAALNYRTGSPSLTGKKIALQGVGNVGRYLLERLVKAGAKVTVSDVNESNIKRALDTHGSAITAVSTQEFYDVDCDIYSPNAVGQTVNHETLGRFKCSIIAGGANNQLINRSVYDVINAKKITYVPDFVINAGGVTSVGCEYRPGGWSKDWTTEKTMGIYEVVTKVLTESEKRGRFPEVVAVELAKERIAAAKNNR